MQTDDFSSEFCAFFLFTRYKSIFFSLTNLLCVCIGPKMLFTPHNVEQLRIRSKQCRAASNCCNMFYCMEWIYYKTHRLESAWPFVCTAHAFTRRYHAQAHPFGAEYMVFSYGFKIDFKYAGSCNSCLSVHVCCECLFRMRPLSIPKQLNDCCVWANNDQMPYNLASLQAFKCSIAWALSWSISILNALRVCQCHASSTFICSFRMTWTH